jgi:UDP-glucose 6-dehydrogenase
LKAYYTLEKISFTDDVLDILKSIYFNFYKIQKPIGKDLNFSKNIFTNIDYTGKTYKELLAIIRALRINNKLVPDALITAFNIAKKEREKWTKDNMNLNVSKLSLQGKNQGH